MLIEKEDFDKLCSSYQKLIRDLEEKYSAIPEEKFHKKWKLLKEFSQNYLMIPKLWEEYLKMLNKDMSLNVKTMLSELINENNYGFKKARFHFCDLTGKTEGRHIHYNFKKLLHSKPNYYHYGSPHIFQPLPVEVVISDLICPQIGMDQTLRYYEENSFSPLPKEAYEKFEKAKKLCAEIIDAENDQIKWFNLISQVENEKYVTNNVDYRLARDLNNVELWKLYINYFKIRNPKRLLRLYSYYCRYFLDDLEMKKKYEEATKIHGPSIVYWKNPFQFETFQVDPDLAFPFPPSLSANVNPRQPQGVFDAFEPQCFSLPKTIMAYVKDTCNPKILHKLHKSCKYFFVILPYPVFHNFEITSRFKLNEDTIFFNQQSMSLNGYRAKLVYDRKIILSNRLNVSSWESLLKTNTFSSIYQCHAKYIYIDGDSDKESVINLKDFQFLVGHGNVEVLYLNEIDILDTEKKEAVGLENILKMVPKIINFHISHPKITLHTYEMLPEINFKNKFQQLKLYYISFIEPYEFCEFLKKNLDQTAEFTARMNDEIDEEIKQNAKDIVKNELKDYWKGSSKPSVSFF